MRVLFENRILEYVTFFPCPPVIYPTEKGVTVVNNFLKISLKTLVFN